MLENPPFEAAGDSIERSAVEGKTGRVTGKIGPRLVGEVMIAVRGGSEAFYAHSIDDEVIERGTQVMVVEYAPPRTVYVTPLNAALRPGSVPRT